MTSSYDIKLWLVIQIGQIFGKVIDSGSGFFFTSVCCLSFIYLANCQNSFLQFKSLKMDSAKCKPTLIFVCLYFVGESARTDRPEQQSRTRNQSVEVHGKLSISSTGEGVTAVDIRNCY